MRYREISMKQDPRYMDLMQEVKERLYTINDVLSEKTAFRGVLAHEFCFLQLRMICECISYACVIAHAYIKELQTPTFQKEWSANALMKELDRLHDDFYPKPRTMTVTENSVQLDEIDVSHLTKANLRKLNGICGEKLHRGSPEKYAFNPTPECLAADRQMIIDFGNAVFRLMESHMIVHRDNARYILCRFRERNLPVEVWYAAADDDVGSHPEFRSACPQLHPHRLPSSRVGMGRLGEIGRKTTSYLRGQDQEGFPGLDRSGVAMVFAHPGPGEWRKAFRQTTGHPDVKGGRLWPRAIWGWTLWRRLFANRSGRGGG